MEDETGYEQLIAQQEREKHLAAAGWQSGDVQDFLRLTDSELREVEARVARHRHFLQTNNRR